MRQHLLRVKLSQEQGINTMITTITKQQIDAAKKKTNYSLDEPHHEHDDCIRIAYEWLDAQHKTKTKCRHPFPLKHLIEKWAGRYVSTSDVEVAATIHQHIKGQYPNYNISSRLIEPSTSRLEQIGEAYKHDYRDRHCPVSDPNSSYKRKEHKNDE
jgi:hypothetical protein